MPSRRRKLLGLALIVAAAVTAVAPEAYPPTEDTIRIWKVGSPHRGEIPDTTLPLALSRQASTQGKRLTVDAFPARGFAARFAEAAARHAAPDILVVNNMGVIEGITTELGRFDGIARDPMIRRELIRVTDAFDELLPPERGWTYLFASSPHHRAARTLALSEPGCSRVASAARREDGLHDLVSNIATAYLEEDEIAFQAHADSERLPSIRWRTEAARVGAARPCGIWGNGRLAFATVKASYESDSVLGQAQVVLVLRKLSQRWQVLVAARDPITNREFVNEVPRIAALLSSDGRESVLPLSAAILYPASGKLPMPWPGERFGSFRWRSSASDFVVAELVEFAYKDDARLFIRSAWRPRALDEISAGQLWTTRSTWTWRVWSITRTGDVVFSESRTFPH
jgi:hypothetical protein